MLVPDAVVMRPSGFQGEAHGATPGPGGVEIVDQDDDVVEARDERRCVLRVRPFTFPALESGREFRPRDWWRQQMKRSDGFLAAVYAGTHASSS